MVFNVSSEEIRVRMSAVDEEAALLRGHPQPHCRQHSGDHEREGDRADDVFDALTARAVLEPARGGGLVNHRL